MKQQLDINIRLYPWYSASSSLLFWFPVFFLYFSSKVTLDQVLLLEAVYYICVVILEVPSGYLSDWLGRRVTLIVSSVCALLCYVMFTMADGLGLLLLAQALLAAHISFKSGTDSALLYESLNQTDRDAEIGNQLARAQRYGLLATSLAALIGGFIGGFKLGLPYVLSAIAAVLTLFLSFKFIEPVKSSESRADPVYQQFLEIISYLKKPTLLWLFIFTILIFILVHVPYEYFQPYIKLLFPLTDDYDRSPVIGGILICLTMLAGSFASDYSMVLKNKFGTGKALILTIIIALFLIVSMAAFLDKLILFIILLRSVPMALSTPIIHAVLHENINDKIRASFLSVLSLLSRLSFSLTLLFSAVFVGSMEQLDYPTLQLILGGYILLTIVLVPVLWSMRKKITLVANNCTLYYISDVLLSALLDSSTKTNN